MFKKSMIASVLALGLLGASAGSAMAQEKVAVFSFDGDATAAVPAVGGGGSFSFDGNVTDCTLISGITPGGCGSDDTISADGTFINVVCGTGEASGDASLSENGNAVSVNFTIAFAAGVGVLVVNPLATTWEGEAAVVGGGDVLLTTPSGDPTECAGGVSGFGISGTAVAVAVDA